MIGTTIHYKADLIIQLLDTTTGRPVDRNSIFTCRDDMPYSMVSRGGGSFIALNVGREDFTLGIKTEGYEDKSVEVRYETLDERLPIINIFLIPKENTGIGEPVLSLAGSLDGIESIEGLCLNRIKCTYSDFDEKKSQMAVFKPQGILSMEDIFYGIINGEESFETFEVTGDDGDCKLTLKAPLKNEFSVNSPIARVVFGQVDGSDYIFRVRDDATSLPYLICYQVRGEKKFRLVDFHGSEEIRLD